MGTIDDLIGYLDASRSPWHAASSTTALLLEAGFQPLSLGDDWTDLPAAGFVASGASVVAFRTAEDADPTSASSAGSSSPSRSTGACC